MSDNSPYSDNNRNEKWIFFCNNEIDYMVEHIDEILNQIEDEEEHEIDKYYRSLKKNNFECDECHSVLPNHDLFEFHICQHIHDDESVSLNEEQLKLALNLEKYFMILLNEKNYKYEDLLQDKKFNLLSSTKKFEFIFKKIMTYQYINHFIKYYSDSLPKYAKYCVKNVSKHYDVKKIDSNVLDYILGPKFDISTINEASEFHENMKKFEDLLISKFDPENRKVNKEGKDFVNSKSYDNFINWMKNDRFSYMFVIEFELDTFHKNTINCLIQDLKKKSMINDYVRAKLDDRIKTFDLTSADRIEPY